MVLLFGAGLMFRSIAKIDALELGFRPDGVMKANMLFPFATYPEPADRRLLVPRVLARVRETEGVRAAAAVFPYPFRGGAGQFPVLTEGTANDEERAPRAGVHTVTPGYFATMDIPLRAGRDFQSTDDHAAPLAVVVSEKLARRIEPSGNVLGRRIRVRVPYLPNFNDEDSRPWRTIVGVVSDMRDDFSLDEPPDVYVPYAQNPRSYMGLVVRAAGSERQIVEPVRRAVTTIDPALSLSGVGSLSEVVIAEGGQRRGLTVLLGAFAIFAVGLSALALYASLSYMVVERRPELALRMAVGASAGAILRMILGEGMLTTCVGIAAGAAASLGLGRVLASQLYAVEPTDPATLVSVSIVLLTTVAAACVIPGARAARIDPGLALRQ
jgi:predicted permease